MLIRQKALEVEVLEAATGLARQEPLVSVRDAGSLENKMYQYNGSVLRNEERSSSCERKDDDGTFM